MRGRIDRDPAHLLRWLLALPVCGAATAVRHRRAGGRLPASSRRPNPKPDETNAERAKTQPGNNAPFWRAVRESGDQPGTHQRPEGRKAAR